MCMCVCVCVCVGVGVGGGCTLQYSSAIFAISFLSQFGDNVGHIIAIPVSYPTGK